MYHNLNTWGIFWMIRVQSVPNVIGRRMGGKLQLLSDIYLFHISLSYLSKYLLTGSVKNF